MIVKEATINLTPWEIYSLGDVQIKLHVNSPRPTDLRIGAEATEDGGVIYTLTLTYPK